MAVLLGAITAVVTVFPGPADGLDFSRDIRPILSDKCFHCHGPDPETRKAGLRLDTPEGAFGALASGGHAIVPGDLDESELMARVDPMFEEEVMPPERSGKSLSGDEVELLRRWVEEGAPWDEHWAFQAPTKPIIPDLGSNLGPIDTYVTLGLEALGLELQGEADPHTLLRRASLDLTGLPPSAEERAAFLGEIQGQGLDTAFESAVDRLLASPRYGVHMARAWLDAARYADTHGLHLDNRRSMWPYRDWVVDALNSNQPFDEFTVEQLAGDLLDAPTQEQVIASGFNRCNPTSAEGGMIAQEYLSIYAKDRADTTAKVWLGLTLECAQCHDHKFDPISQRDYYGMYAFFNSLDEEATDRNIENPKPFLRAMDGDTRAKVTGLEEEIAALELKLETTSPAIEAKKTAWIEDNATAIQERWRVLVPGSATATGGTDLVIDSVSGEVIAQGPNPERSTYTLEYEVGNGRVEGLRLDALVPEGQSLPGRARNHNFVLSHVEVEAAPMDPAVSYQRVPLREAVATYSQKDWSVEGALDPSPANGWAGLHREGDRSALFLAARSFGFEGGTRVRIKLHFKSKHTGHSLGRFRVALGVDPSRSGALGQSLWWRARFPAESAESLYEVERLAESAFEEGVDLLQPAGDGVHWVPEPAFVPDTAHALDSGLGVDYLVKRIVAPEASTYQLRLGSDDGLMVWLNGQGVHENRAARPVALDQDLVPLELVEGSNEILVKVVNTGGAGGFAWRLWDMAGTGELDGRVTLDLQVLDLEEILGGTDGESSSEYGEFLTMARRAVDRDFDAAFERRGDLRAEVEELKSTLPTTLVSRELDMRRDARIQMRGAYDQLGDVVPPATPAVLPPLPADVPRDRLALAKWIVSGANPLTARVWVNRAWQHFFGVGIVSTPGDFGSQGAWPTHPELLDWLAVTFMEEGWDQKAMHRRMVLSKAYRQSSHRSPERLELDPEGAMVSSGPRFRLDGEALRDQALYLAGLLDETMGGPGVYPYQPDGVWFAVGYSRSNTVRYANGPTGDQRRRSLYTFWKRTAPPPNLTTFDAPMRDTCTVRRERTNTPLQALVTLNDTTYVEAAKFIALRVLGETAAEDVSGEMFEHVVGKPASKTQTSEVRGLAADLYAAFELDQGAAEALLGVGDIELPPNAFETRSAAEVAAWSVVASTLLNLDEVLTND